MAPELDVKELHNKSIMIRDELEPDVALRGPGAISADTLLLIHDFFLALVDTPVCRIDLKVSRIHKAVSQVRGKATRWPGRLVDICDVIFERWTKQFSKLTEIHPILYEPGGRLYGIANPKDTSRRTLVHRWEEDQQLLVCPENAHLTGSLDFSPGDWWIHPIFAYREGIIDNFMTDGCVTADSDVAYAITMGGNEELKCPSMDQFTFRPKHNDFGRHKLTKAFIEGTPIRVLRCYALHSPWAPRVGIRYDGLYKVAGFTFHNVEGQMTLEFHFERLLDQGSIKDVLARPTAEEMDDFHEYRRIRNLHIQYDAEAQGSPRRRRSELTSSVVKSIEDWQQQEPFEAPGEPSSHDLADGEDARGSFLDDARLRRRNFGLPSDTSSCVTASPRSVESVSTTLDSPRAARWSSDDLLLNDRGVSFDDLDSVEAGQSALSMDEPRPRARQDGRTSLF